MRRMRFVVTLGIASFLIILMIFLPTKAQEATQNFVLQGRGVDWCFTFSQANETCGYPTASYFCQQQGYSHAISYQTRPVPTTRLIGSGEICAVGVNFGQCDEFTNIVCAQGKQANNSSSSSTISQFEAEMLELTNSQRRNAGLPPLRLSPQLSQAAQTYAEDASRNPNLPPHIGSDGSSVGDRVTRTGYGFSFVGENVYFEIPRSRPANAVQWWMNSPGHRANILGQNYREIGFGYVYNPADQRHVFVQVFGTPR
jgi:uncharacterized protein YkwD